MSIKKQFLKSKDAYKVTWSIDKKTAGKADSISLSGSFNNWSHDSDPFQKLKNGTFKLVMELPKGTEHEFRYLVNGTEWINEEQADGFTDNLTSNEQNCILSL